MKIGNRGLFILAVTWLVVSMLWFLWVKNTAIGIIWLTIGIVTLIIAFANKRQK